MNIVNTKYGSVSDIDIKNILYKNEDINGVIVTDQMLALSILEKADLINRILKADEYVTYLGLKCKYRLNTGHLRKLRNILRGKNNV